MLGGLSAYELTLVGLIFVFGGIVKGALGFGLPLATMAILPMVIDVDFGLAINGFMLMMTNLTQFVQSGHMRDSIVRFRHVVLGVVAGVPLGAVLVSWIRDASLMIALGVFIFLFVASAILTPRLVVPPAREREIGTAVGVVAGIVGALTTANGPVFIMHLLALKVERAVFMSALALFFIVTGALVSSAFWFSGVLTGPRLAVTLFCVPMAILGMFIGNAIGSRISAERFRRLVLGFLCILAANLIVQGVAKL